MNPWIYLTVDIAMDNITRGEQNNYRSQIQTTIYRFGTGLENNIFSSQYIVQYILYCEIQ